MTEKEFSEALAQYPEARSWWQTLDGAGIPPSVRERTQRAFLEGVRRETSRPSRSANPSSPEDSPRPTSNASMVKIRELDPSNPMVRPASEDDWVREIIGISTALNLADDAERIRGIARIMSDQKWTVAEVQMAGHVILSNPKISEKPTYQGAVTPTVYAMARVDPRVRMGRLYTGAQALRLAERFSNGSDSRRRDIMNSFEPVTVRGSKGNFLALTSTKAFPQ